MSIKEIRIRRDGENVILIQDNHHIVVPYSAALVVFKEALSQAKLIEEEMNAAGIIKDQAILIKSGVGLGLTSNPKLVREALKIAEDLKVKSLGRPVVVGTPAVIQRNP